MPFSSALTSDTGGCSRDARLRPSFLARYSCWSARSIQSVGEERTHCGAKADRHRKRLAARHRHRRLLDLLADALRHHLAIGRGAVGQDDREFFPAEAGHGVHRPHAVRQGRGHRLQHQVARGMAVGVVDHLEAVDVDHQHQGRLAGPRHAVDLARQGQLELAAVGQPGQRVPAGHVAQRVDHRLQPGDLAGLVRVGQLVPRLRQQLQGRGQAQRGRWAGGWRCGYCGECGHVGPMGNLEPV